MIGRTLKVVALVVAVAVVPAFLSAQTAADAMKNSASSAIGAAKDAAANVAGLKTVLDGGDFKTLSEALNKADLLPMLTDGKSYTIFAPTDTAFKKIPEADLKALLNNPTELKKVLQNHVVVGKVAAADAIAMAGKDATTAAGTKVPVTVVDGKVHYGAATVTKADVAAGPSVVHVIDTVVLPAPAAADAKKEVVTEKKTEKTEKKEVTTEKKTEPKKEEKAK